MLRTLTRFAGALLLATTLATAAVAQDATLDADRKRAMELFDAQNFVDSIPLLERVTAASPSDVNVLERLGFALLATSPAIKDEAARKATRERARAMLLKAKELGDDSNLLKLALEYADAVDAADVPYSKNGDADAAIRAGEVAYSQGKLEEALADYERAFSLDPQLYEAALYAGDMHFKTKGWEKAAEWFARAIAVGPDRETAYRYWGDALMAQNKMNEARDKFVDAIVAEPYSRQPRMGLMQWADRYGVELAHPEIEIPTGVSKMEGNKMTITIDPRMLDDEENGSGAWVGYGIVRAAWATSLFKEHYPKEPAYRHTLAEESAALSLVVDTVRRDTRARKIKRLEPSLANLVRLADAGLLEPYVLFARVDDGIAQDYADYRKANREKLRRYWLEMVIPSDKRKAI